MTTPASSKESAYSLALKYKNASLQDSGYRASQKNDLQASM